MKHCIYKNLFGYHITIFVISGFNDYIGNNLIVISGFNDYIGNNLIGIRHSLKYLLSMLSIMVIKYHITIFVISGFNDYIGNNLIGTRHSLKYLLSMLSIMVIKYQKAFLTKSFG